MATTLQDCSEVEKMLGYGLDPDPIIISKGGSFAATNYTKIDGCYKDVLTAANKDYLAVGSYNITTLNDVDFEVDFVPEMSVTGGIFHIGKFTNSRIGSISLLNTTTDLIISFRNDSDVSIASYSTPASANQEVSVRIKDSLIYLDDVMVDDWSIHSSELINAVSKPYFVGRYHGASTWLYNDVDILNFTINGESFHPDSEGVTYTGSEGTIVTRNTSAANPEEYIDKQMIQPCYV